MLPGLVSSAKLEKTKGGGGRLLSLYPMILWALSDHVDAQNQYFGKNLRKSHKRKKHSARWIIFLKEKQYSGLKVR